MMLSAITSSRAAAAAARPLALRLFATPSDGKEAVGEAIKETARDFKKDGSVGQKFEAEGEIGGKVQDMADKGAIPKAFSKDGSIGHQFTSKGSVGGTVQQMAEKEEQVGERLKKEGEKERSPEESEGHATRRK